MTEIPSDFKTLRSKESIFNIPTAEEEENAKVPKGGKSCNHTRSDQQSSSSLQKTEHIEVDEDTQAPSQLKEPEPEVKGKPVPKKIGKKRKSETFDRVVKLAKCDITDEDFDNRSGESTSADCISACTAACERVISILDYQSDTNCQSDTNSDTNSDTA